MKERSHEGKEKGIRREEYREECDVGGGKRWMLEIEMDKTKPAIS